MARQKTPLRIDIRDQRLPGGRLALSARTTKVAEKRERERALRTLIDMGRLDIIRQVQERRLHIADAARAVQEERVDQLRRAAAPGEISLGNAIERFRRTVRATLAEKTQQQYEHVCNKLLEHFGEEVALASISTQQAESWLHEPKHGHEQWRNHVPRVWSPRRQHVAAAVAGRIWKMAIDDQVEKAERSGQAPPIFPNPWRKVSLPRVRATRVGFLLPEEWNALLKKVRGHPQAAWLALACLAGLRMSEARHLRSGLDVDLAEGVIRIQPREGEHAWRPKSDNSVREVPISAALRPILEEHAERFAGQRYFLTTAGEDRPISTGTATHWTREAFRAAGIRYGRDGDGLTYHSLRHTFASWLCQSNVQMKIIAELIGDTTEVVDRTYAHLLPHDLRRAMLAIDEKIGHVSTEIDNGDGRPR